MKRFSVFFGAWFVFVAALGVGLTAFGVWTIYQLVMWITSH